MNDTSARMVLFSIKIIRTHSTPTTTISFKSPDQAVVTLKVYGVLGQEIATLGDRQTMDDRDQEVDFDASRPYSGVYFHRLVEQTVSSEEEGIAGKTYISITKVLLFR